MQFSTHLSSSDGIIKKKFFKNFYSIGSQCSVFHKIGNARGVKNLKIRCARGLLFMEDNPRDWIILAKKCMVPFLYAL